MPQLQYRVMKFPISILTNLHDTLFPLRCLAPFHVGYCASFLVVVKNSCYLRPEVRARRLRNAIADRDSQFQKPQMPRRKNGPISQE